MEPEIYWFSPPRKKLGVSICTLEPEIIASVVRSSNKPLLKVSLSLEPDWKLNSPEPDKNIPLEERLVGGVSPKAIVPPASVLRAKVLVSISKLVVIISIFEPDNEAVVALISKF